MIDSRILELMSQEVQAGITENDSKYVTDAESSQAFKDLEATYKICKKLNIVMAIPFEWDNTDYEVGSLYSDTFYTELDAFIAKDQASVEETPLAPEAADEPADQTSSLPESDTEVD